MKQNGQMVQAVKSLREKTGLDLVRAKQYIDRLSKQCSCLSVRLGAYLCRPMGRLF